VAITSPVHDGSTITEPFLVGDTLTVEATILDDSPVWDVGVAWQVTSPSGQVSRPAGTLLGQVTSLATVLTESGAWLLRVSYTDGVNPEVSAQVTAHAYTDLPPRLAWLHPANNGATVTGYRRVGATQLFQVSLRDDHPLQPLGVTWTHTAPDGTPAVAQGTFTAQADGSARLEHVVTLSTQGAHVVRVAYDDGTTTGALVLRVEAWTDFPPAVVFTAPENDGTRALSPVAVGDTLVFRVALDDDVDILDGHGAFLVTPPGAAAEPHAGSTLALGTHGVATLSLGFDRTGTWTVAYTYTDGSAHAATAALAVEVAEDPAPQVTITDPSHDGTALTGEVREGSGLTFHGLITDNAPVSPLAVTWTYHPAGGGVPQAGQGVLGGGGTALTTTWALPDVGGPGLATVSLGYTDGSGNTTVATLQVTVTSATAPRVDILEPAHDGTRVLGPVRLGDVVTFRAQVTDDVTVRSAGLSWTVTSPGGATRTSPGSHVPGSPDWTAMASLAVAMEAEGTWRVAVTYTDADLQRATAAVLADAYQNQPPTCEIRLPQACLAPGFHSVTLVLADADGNLPVGATFTSSNANDVVNPATVSGSGAVAVTVYAPEMGSRQWTCTPTDALGRLGAVVSRVVPFPVAASVELAEPAEGMVLQEGGTLRVTARAQVDPGAEPSATSVVDSVAGPLAVDGAGRATLARPAPGLHDVYADVEDACGQAAADGPVRYAVTPTGQGRQELGRLADGAGPTHDVRCLAPHDADRLVVGTADGASLYEAVTGRWSAFNPNTDPDGDAMPSTTPLLSVSVAGAVGAPGRLEAYGTQGRGLWVCVPGGAEGQTRCKQVQMGPGRLLADTVKVVLALPGTGGGGVVVAAMDAGVQVLDGTGAVLATESGVAGRVRGTPQGLTRGGGGQVWLATSQGAYLLAYTPGVPAGTLGVTNFDLRNNQVTLPSYNVRAVLVDPGNPDVQWMVTAGGLGRHRGPGYQADTWAVLSETRAGTVPGNLVAGVVERWPDASRPVLWLATSSGGILRLDAADERLLLMTRIRAQDGVGLPSDQVRATSVLAGDAGHVKWWATPNGLWGYLGR
jgi:acyl dehydratase